MLPNIKDVLAIVREATIIVVVAILWFDPPAILRWVKAMDAEAAKQGASKREYNFVVAKYTFEQASQQVVELTSASKSIDDIRAQLVSLGKSGSPQVASQAKELLKRADDADKTLQTSISSAKAAVLKADQAAHAGSYESDSGGPLAIVVSADKQPDLALYEVEKLHRGSFPDIEVYRVGSYLRTVTRFPDKADADKALGKIQGYRPTAYEVDVDALCPGRKDTGEKLGLAPIFSCSAQ